MRGGLLIYIAGMDGSGKSTLSKILCEELAKKGLDVSYLWWLEGEDSPIRKLLRIIGQGRRSGLSNSKDDSCPQSMNKAFQSLYVCAVMFDYLVFSLRRIRIHSVGRRGRIVVLDRYIFDVAQALSIEFPSMRVLCNSDMLIRLFPEPDLVYILSVTPERSYERKSEEFGNMESAIEVWRNFQGIEQAIRRRLKPVVINNNNSEIDLARNEIIHRTEQYLLEKRIVG